MTMIALVHRLRSKCLITRRSEGVHLGSSILWLLERNKIQVRMQVVADVSCVNQRTLKNIPTIRKIRVKKVTDIGLSEIPA